MIWINFQTHKKGGLPTFWLALALLGSCLPALGAEEEPTDLPTMTVFSPGDLRSIPIRQYHKEVESAKRAYTRGEYDEAFQQMQRTARWGDKANQYLLGTMYLNGYGTETDVWLGVAWIRLSVEDGLRYPWFRQYQQLEDSMTEADRAQVDELYERLKAAHGVKAIGIRCGRPTGKGSHLRYTRCERISRPRATRFVIQDGVPYEVTSDNG